MRADRTPRLVLWDIDQTLIDAGSSSRHAYAAAFHRATGAVLRQPWRFDGRTELAAATEVLRMHGFEPDDGLLETFLELIVAELVVRGDAMAGAGRVLPGALAALTAVRDAGGVHQSVLTGNLYRLAELKLGIFGLRDHVDLRIGAYGEDAYERTDLPSFAFARTERHLGHRHTGASTVIVGDTVRDVRTARAVGARVVAVATGTTDAGQLRAAGADVVLTDLADTDAVLDAIFPVGES